MFGDVGMVAHPQGGCVIEWGSYTSESMRLARVDAAGTIVWNISLGDTFSSYYEQSQEIIATPAGFYLTVVRGSDVYNQIYVLHVSLAGQILWPMTSVAPLPMDDSRDMGRMAVDNAGNLIVAWSAFSHATLTRHISAQKLSPSGDLMWGDSGRVVVDTPPGQVYPSVASDGSDGVFVTWGGFWGAGTVYGTHLTADGWSGQDPYWVQNQGGILADSGAFVPGATITIPDGNGEIVVVWQQDLQQSEAADQGISAQRVIANSVYAGGRTASLPQKYALHQNYPNPFNPTTQIIFDLPQAGVTQLKVFNLLGREVTTLVNRYLPSGEHRVSFDASTFASGVYFYRMKSGSFVSTRKMLVLK
jgi:hypothetical protein